MPRLGFRAYRARCIAIAGIAGALLFGCTLDGEQPQTTSGIAVTQEAIVTATEPKQERPAEIDQLREENRQLIQALDVTLANQQDLASRLHKTNEALAALRSDVALVRERLHDLELAYESHPLPQHPAAAPAVAQQR